MKNSADKIRELLDKEEGLNVVAPERCQDCGSTNTQDDLMGAGFVRYCNNCNRFMGLLPYDLGKATFETATFPFGKHRGEKIINIPLEYLKWLDSNCTLKPYLKSLVSYAISRAENRHILRDKKE